MKNTTKRICCLLLTIVMIVGLFPVLTGTASAVSLEEKQRAIILTAFAYYDKGAPVQYDSMGLSDVKKQRGGTLRSTHETPPEYASPDETAYSVCSDFTYQVYYDVFGFRCCGNPIRNCCAILSLYNPGKDPICIYKYNSQTDDTPREEAIDKYIAQLQPGDIIDTNSKEGSGGHAMLYIGDFLGDGHKYILHCGGRKYDTKTGEDYIECSPGMVEAIPGRIKIGASAMRNNGAILLSDTRDYLMSHYAKSKNRVFNLIRPLAVIDDATYPMSAAAKGRLQCPRLVYNRTASPYTRFNDVPAGETLTLKVELKNCSDKAYTVPVKETVPEGVTFVKASDGAKVDGKNISWDVSLGAGETKTVSYDCTVTAKRGETVTFAGGSASTIPSNTLYIRVGGKHLTDAENALLTEVANGGHAELFKDVKKDDLPNVVWQKLLNLNVSITTPKKLVKEVLETTKVADNKLYLEREDLQPGEALDARFMLVPEFAGGFKYGVMDSLHRVLDLKCDYLQPGDVVFQMSQITAPSVGKTLIYLGNRQFLAQSGINGGAEIADWFELQKCHTYQLFFALRPTLAYDDVHAPEASKNTALPATFKFTDVPKDKWYYNNVKTLVRDGTVSGMTATTFEPNGNLTWGQALKLIAIGVYQWERERETAHWASGWLRLAKINKWVDGDVDLDSKITRLELCHVAARAKNLTEQPKTNPFTDTSDPDVLALNKAGVISGMTATTFEPNGLLTRAQISKIICALRDAKAGTAPAPTAAQTSAEAAVSATDEDAG